MLLVRLVDKPIRPAVVAIPMFLKGRSPVDDERQLQVTDQEERTYDADMFPRRNPP